MASTEVERHNGVDVEDVPSADWGWSKENIRLIHVGGVLGALFLLSMVHWGPGWGNHVGRTEDVFLFFFAIVILVLVFRDWWLRKRGWHR